MDKNEIRKLMIEKRNNLKNKQELDKFLLKHVMNYAKQYQTIAIFHSFKNEINTHPMIEALLKLGKTVACPKIDQGMMRFFKVSSLNDFIKGSYDIMEPIGNKEVKVEDFDLIFVPLLAYNDDFYRIGYGGGFYDRYLTNMSGKKVGLAYSLNYINEEFQEPFDIQLDQVLTEKGFIS